MICMACCSLISGLTPNCKCFQSFAANDLNAIEGADTVLCELDCYAPSVTGALGLHLPRSGEALQDPVLLVHHITAKADIYSYGVVLWVSILAYLACFDINDMMLDISICRGQLLKWHMRSCSAIKPEGPQTFQAGQATAVCYCN